MVETAERTILFADIVGSTHIYARMGDQRAFAWLSRVLAGLDAVVVRHDGRRVKHLGDAVLAAFADPEAAVAASSALHTAAAEEDIELRIGMQAGAVTFADDGDVHGDAVNVAARLEHLAAPGETLLGEAVRDRLPGPAQARIRHFDDRVLAGHTAPLRIYQCLAPGMAHGATSLAGPRVGRRQGPGAWRLSHGDTTRPVPPAPAQLTVGRSPDCEVVVAERVASRRHVALAVRDGGVAVEDMSTNGTYLREAGGCERFLHRECVIVPGFATLSLGETLSRATPGVLMELTPGPPDEPGD